MVQSIDSQLPVFIPMAALLLIGTLLWLRIDPTEELMGMQTAAETLVLPVEVE